MIIKMKKVTAVCLQSERALVLDKLSDAGAAHLTLTKKKSDKSMELEGKLALVSKTIGILKAAGSIESVDINVDGENPASFPDRAQTPEDILALSAKIDALKNKLKDLAKDEKALLPWGNCSPEIIGKIRAGGIHIYFCIAEEDKFQAIAEKHSASLVNKTGGTCYFVITSDKELDKRKFRTADIFDKKISLSEVQETVRKTSSELDAASLELKSMGSKHKELQLYKNEIKDRLALVVANDSMSDSGPVAYIQGFVPETKLAAVKKISSELHFALLIEEPSAEDQAPTLIEEAKPFRMARPILDFVGVLPGYKEWDVSGSVLIFFTIYFALIVNDGGYGLIFLAAALGARLTAKSDKVRLPANLFILLSLVSIIWGVLSGNFFGIPHEHLPGWLRGLPVLAHEESRDKAVQFVSFTLAAIHLSAARIWQAFLHAKSKKLLGEIGWAMLLWGNFFVAVELIIYKGFFAKFGALPYVLYIVGFLLILIFYVHWSDMGEVFMFPLHIMSSFVDILSYIRLFALGVAGLYIAESFNKMGLLVYNSFSGGAMVIVAVAVMVIIFILGHLLNIGLACIGVMVHDIRLNVLEFSNQMGLKWTGVKYNPLSKSTNKKEL